MPDFSHQGARAPGIAAPPVDRRIGEIDDALRSLEAQVSPAPNLGFARDPFRANSTFQALNREHFFTRGVVIHAIPYLNWYKVQVGHGSGTIACMAIVGGSLVPVGPRPTGVYSPNESVLVLKISGLNFGIIMGAMPPGLADASLSCPDWILQGGGTGFKREAAHTFPLTSTYQQGGVVDWSANRPIDELAFWKGHMSANGPLLGLTDWMVVARVNEMCGLFMTVWDSWCRLAGVQLTIESSVHEDTYKDDEGEAHVFRGVAAYPWEALGLFEPGQAFTTENDDTDVQYSLNRGKVDLAAEREDVQPIYRTFSHGGYLGQGSFRGVMAPRVKSEPQRYSDASDAGTGLFRETVGLDGSFTLVSAKRVFIGKRCKIAVPKEIRVPEDAGGDDAAANNYKASGFFGNGPEHAIVDVTVTGEALHMRRAAGVNDLAAYLVNWQGLHPFHFHAGDYVVPQESVDPVFERIQERLPFDNLIDEAFLPEATARPLHIDHRYGNVQYFEREAFLVFHDDGTVQLGGGCGEHIVFSGGDISIEAPGKVKVIAGTDVVVMAGQVCVRSRGSLDLSSAQGDVRLKAERNLHMLAGNSGSGGLFLESKGEGSAQQFDGRFGEDVRSSGIVLKAANGLAAILAKDIYLRTGETLGEGDITIDASKGKRNCYVYARECNIFSTSAVQFFYGPLDEDSTVNKAYSFGSEAAMFDAGLFLGGKLVGYKNAGILMDGPIFASDNIATAGRVADRLGGSLGKVPDNFGDAIDQVAATAGDDVKAIIAVGKKKHETVIVDKYYGTDEIGSIDTLKSLGFSFRDPPINPGKQYGTKKLFWPEARWQMMARLGMATGGQAWEEPPVVCQGALTYPWPGKAKWQDEAIFLRSGRPSMFNAEAGYDADRPYLDPTLSPFEKTTMAAGVTSIR